MQLGGVEPELRLPALRADLALMPGPATPDGEPTWTVVDPANGRHFRVGWRAFQLLSRWREGQASALVERVNAETTADATLDDVKALVQFAWTAGLTVLPASGRSSDYASLSAARRQSWWQWLVHRYLFVRIPLVRPDAFLKATLPFVEPLYSPLARWLVVLAGVVGLYLAVQQWETFATTFGHLFSLEGVLVLGLALIVVKVAHELAHGWTATRYGCRVPTMGVALLVMWPVLYTDATESWRLRSRAQRMRIAAAGMSAEFAIALLATFAWALLPDGALRSAAFFLATVSWVTSLLVNANPCMRFDGYYLLADWLGVDNLQERAFARGRWALRKALFGAPEPAPEAFSPSTGHTLVIYAWCVWVYRFFLFLAIGLLVYHFFFKALGIILFAVEIGWFIVLPIVRETATWWRMRGTLAQAGHARVTLLLLLGIVALLFVPLPGRVNVPAVLEAEAFATVHAPEAARVARVVARRGAEVQAGEVLFELESPTLDHALTSARERLALQRTLYQRGAAGGRDSASLATLRESLRGAEVALAGLEEERDNLTVRAPIDGVVADLASSLHPGRWVAPTLALALVTAEGARNVRGYVTDTAVARVTEGAPARFFPDDGAVAPLDAEVRRVEQTNTERLDLPYLASEYGGDIAVRVDESGSLAPERAIYRVELTPLALATGLPPRIMRGTAQVSVEPRSLAERTFERVAAVFVRESGF